MRFAQAVIAASALVGSALAQLAFTTVPASVVAGQSYEIRYEAEDINSVSS